MPHLLPRPVFRYDFLGLRRRYVKISRLKNSFCAISPPKHASTSATATYKLRPSSAFFPLSERSLSGAKAELKRSYGEPRKSRLEMLKSAPSFLMLLTPPVTGSL